MQQIFSHSHFSDSFDLDEMTLTKRATGLVFFWWEKKIHNRSNKLWTAYFVMHQDTERMTQKKDDVVFPAFFPDKNILKICIYCSSSFAATDFSREYLHPFFFLVSHTLKNPSVRKNINEYDWEPRTKVIKLTIKMVGSLLFSAFFHMTNVNAFNDNWWVNVRIFVTK